MNSDRWTVGGALTAAMGAAASWLCCLPIALGAMGTGSAALASTLGPWRPVFTGLSLGLLAAAFVQALRRQRTCFTGGCPRPRWWWLAAAATLTVLLLTVPRWASWVIYWSL